MFEFSNNAFRMSWKTARSRVRARSGGGRMISGVVMSTSAHRPTSPAAVEGPTTGGGTPRHARVVEQRFGVSWKTAGPDSSEGVDRWSDAAAAPPGGSASGIEVFDGAS